MWAKVRDIRGSTDRLSVTFTVDMEQFAAIGKHLADNTKELDREFVITPKQTAEAIGDDRACDDVHEDLAGDAYHCVLKMGHSEEPLYRAGLESIS